MKKIVKLTEGQLKQIIENQILTEGMRVNPEILRIKGGYVSESDIISMDDIIEELQEILTTMRIWEKEGVTHISAPTSPSEWIPLWR